LGAGIIDEADRRAHPELPAPRLVELAAEQPRAEHMQLGLTHRAFEPEE
jgi:hypothetical protein